MQEVNSLHTDSRELRTKYCIVGILHSTVQSSSYCYCWHFPQIISSQRTVASRLDAWLLVHPMNSHSVHGLFGEQAPQWKVIRWNVPKPWKRNCGNTWNMYFYTGRIPPHHFSLMPVVLYDTNILLVIIIIISDWCWKLWVLICVYRWCCAQTITRCCSVVTVLRQRRSKLTWSWLDRRWDIVPRVNTYT